LREGTYLKHRYAAVTAAVGRILVLAGGIMLSPLVALLWYPAESADAMAFVAPAACLGLLGVLLWLGFREAAATSISVQEGGVVVVVSWVVAMLFSAWPFCSLAGLPYSAALFESVSGWTTTGLSVVDVGQASRMLLLYRSVLQLAGGAGLAIIMMSAIVGPTGVGIPSAEGRNDQLVPQVRQSSRLVLKIYLCYAGLGFAAYVAAGMTPFDAVNHSFAAVSTGGFSTHSASIGHWDSVAIEAVTLPLMVLGNLSFVTAWLLLRFRVRTGLRSGEIRLTAILLSISAASLLLVTCRELYPGLGKAARVAVFESVSALTTTGFSTVGYGPWNAFGMWVLVILMLVGGGTCSTAGGIKQYRVYMLGRLVGWEIKRSLAPSSVVCVRPVWEGDRRADLSDAAVVRLAVFISLYLGTYALGTLTLCASGFNLGDSLFEFASALGTVGLSVGVTSVGMPRPAMLAETLGMFLGRLELVVVVASVVKLASDGGGALRWLVGARRGTRNRSGRTDHG
jgi:trk system potassium uptake protein TrkH